MKKWVFCLILVLLTSHVFGAVDFEQSATESLSQADGLSTDISGADQSLSIWSRVRFESLSLTGDAYIIASKYSFSNNNRQYMFENRFAGGVDTIRCLISADGLAASAAVGGTTPVADTEYSLACVYNDTDIRIYLDGVLDSNGASNPKSHTTGIFDSTALFGIGIQKASSGDANAFDGIIREVCVWNTALTASEVALLDSSKRRMCWEIQPANLQLYCLLDDCADGASCSSAFRCTPGSDVSPTNTPTGSGERVISYP